MPALGIAFIAFMIIGFLVGGEPPDHTNSGDRIAQYYTDHKDRLQFAVLILLVATILFIFASGLSIVLHKSLPVWLGWAAIVIGVVGVTPFGWLSFFGTAAWILVTCVVLLMRDRNTVPSPTATAT